MDFCIALSVSAIMRFISSAMSYILQIVGVEIYLLPLEICQLLSYRRMAAFAISGEPAKSIIVHSCATIHPCTPQIPRCYADRLFALNQRADLLTQDRTFQAIRLP